MDLDYFFFENYGGQLYPSTVFGEEKARTGAKYMVSIKGDYDVL